MAHQNIWVKCWNSESPLRSIPVTLPTMPYTVHIDLCVVCASVFACVCAHLCAHVFVHVCVGVCVWAERNRRFYEIGEEFLATKVLGELATDEIDHTWIWLDHWGCWLMRKATHSAVFFQSRTSRQKCQTPSMTCWTWLQARYQDKNKSICK